MANITELKEKARLLNLQNLASGKIDVSQEQKANLEFLDRILSRELELRKERKIEKLKRASGFPKGVFNFNSVPNIVSWQIEKLLKFEWIEDNQNLFIIGECNTGKTSLMSYIGNKAIEREYKAAYFKIDELLTENKNTMLKLKDTDLIVIDDILYLPLPNEKLQQLYRKLIFLNESRSIALITNRELSGWIECSEDKHTMQTLLDRLNGNAQTLRLNKNK